MNETLCNPSEETKEKTRKAFKEIMEHIDEYCEKLDALFEGCTPVDKAFVLGTYIMKLRGELR